MTFLWMISDDLTFQGAAAVIDVFVWRMRRNRRRYLMGEDSPAATGRINEDEDTSATTATGSSVASWLRFVEYSFSASVMIVAIALQVGIMDAWMLFALAALTWVTMILGLVAERVLAVEEDIAALVLHCGGGGGGKGDDTRVSVHLNAGGGTTAAVAAAADGNDDNADNDDNSAAVVSSGSTLLSKKKGGAAAVASTARQQQSAAISAACAGLSLPLVRWAAHFAGWVTQGVVFVVIIAHFFTSQRTCEFADAPGGRDENVAPDFVYAIVFCELGLFACFGLTQLAQFMAYDTWRGGGGGGGGGRRCGQERHPFAPHTFKAPSY